MTDPKRILILTADAGFGHRSAAQAIEAALQATHGADSIIEVVNALNDERTPGWLRDTQSDYDRIARDLPDLYRLGYDLSDGSLTTRVMDNALRTLLYPVMRALIRQHRPDVIVSTYPLYQASLGSLFALSKTYVPLITVVTDLATVHQVWFASESDLTVVPTTMVYDLALGAGLPANKLEIIGIPVHPRLVQETRDKAALRAELGWDQDRAAVLVVGSKRVGNLEPTLNVLNHSGLPLQLCIAAGGDDARYQAWQDTTWHVPVHLYNFVKNMPTLMRAADCVICKAGGLIVTEALAAELPMLLTDVIPGQETGNANYVIAGGAGELLADPISALETMCHWLQADRHMLHTRSANAAKLGRPRAAFDIAERAWQLAQTGPQTRDAAQIVGLPRLVELFQRFNVRVDEG